ncbi:hypothetical protein GCM10010214_46370 [Streptomyces abikoensis]|nr:hypothetical protein GCM10010214_46370 [Streptomyces abikoensis]
MPSAPAPASPTRVPHRTVPRQVLREAVSFPRVRLVGAFAGSPVGRPRPPWVPAAGQPAPSVPPEDPGLRELPADVWRKLPMRDVLRVVLFEVVLFEVVLFEVVLLGTALFPQYRVQYRIQYRVLRTASRSWRGRPWP